MFMQEMTMEEFAARRAEVTSAILPVGALEEHGRHLPLGLDAMHALALARETARLHPCFVVPPLFYGLCRSSSQHPGTLGISGDTLRACVRDIGHGLERQGMRCLCILTGHASPTHQGALVEAAEGLLEAGGLELAVVCVLDLVKEAEHLLQCPGDSHAGEVETSLAMHLWPELVKGSAPEEYPTFPKYLLVRDKRAHWPGGVWGDPSLASAEKGKAVFDIEAQALARVLASLERARAGRTSQG